MLQRKRKDTTLILEKKLKILNKIEKGDKLVNFVNEFRIGRVTTNDIRKNSKNVKNFFNAILNKIHKTLRTNEFPEVEDTQYLWFL